MIYNEEAYKLWWEYLKRSEPYKLYCLSRYSLSLPYFDYELFELETIKNLPDDALLRALYLKFTYDKFGDVHKSSFNDWWEKRQSDEAVEDLSEIYKKEFFSYLKYLKHFRKQPVTHEEIYEMLRDFLKSYPFGDYIFLKINASAKDKDIRDAVSKAVKTRKKKHTVQLDALKKYLLVYDGRKAGKSDGEIASEVFERVETSTEISYMEPRKDQRGAKEPLAPKQVSDYLRDYNKFAERIIKNVEMGNFPGEFRKQEEIKKTIA